jgi:hypothetical protein
MLIAQILPPHQLKMKNAVRHNPFLMPRGVWRIDLALLPFFEKIANCTSQNQFRWGQGPPSLLCWPLPVLCVPFLWVGMENTLYWSVVWLDCFFCLWICSFFISEFIGCFQLPNIRLLAVSLLRELYQSIFYHIHL